jgi:hypothetical protein
VLCVLALCSTASARSRSWIDMRRGHPNDGQPMLASIPATSIRLSFIYDRVLGFRIIFMRVVDRGTTQNRLTLGNGTAKAEKE